jgi:hypothetical protein
MIGTDAKMVHLGVLACGVVAQMDYLPGVKRKEFENLASVVAVCDSDETRARNVARQFNVPNSYTSLNEMGFGSNFIKWMFLSGERRSDSSGQDRGPDCRSGGCVSG